MNYSFNYQKYWLRLVVGAVILLLGFIILFLLIEFNVINLDSTGGYILFIVIAVALLFLGRGGYYGLTNGSMFAGEGTATINGNDVTITMGNKTYVLNNIKDIKMSQVSSATAGSKSIFSKPAESTIEITTDKKLVIYSAVPKTDNGALSIFDLFNKIIEASDRLQPKTFANGKQAEYWYVA